MSERATAYENHSLGRETDLAVQIRYDAEVQCNKLHLLVKDPREKWVAWQRVSGKGGAILTSSPPTGWLRDRDTGSGERGRNTDRHRGIWGPLLLLGSRAIPKQVSQGEF